MNPDLSAVVDVFVRDGELSVFRCSCLAKCALMQRFPRFHTFTSLSAVCITSEHSGSS